MQLKAVQMAEAAESEVEYLFSGVVFSFVHYFQFTSLANYIHSQQPSTFIFVENSPSVFTSKVDYCLA